MPPENCSFDSFDSEQFSDQLKHLQKFLFHWFFCQIVVRKHDREQTKYTQVLSFKGGLISESFSLWLEHPMKGANASLENTFLWWMLRAKKSDSATFLEIRAKVKNSLSTPGLSGV